MPRISRGVPLKRPSPVTRERQGPFSKVDVFLVARKVRGALRSLSSSVTPCTVRRGVWSPARRGAASVPTSSFFPGLVQDLLSPFILSSCRFIHQPNPGSLLSLSFSASSSLPPLTPASPFLATISTSARLRLDIDIHWRMPPLEYPLLEAASRASFAHASHPAGPLARSLEDRSRIARGSLEDRSPRAAPFLFDLPLRGRSSSRSLCSIL